MLTECISATRHRPGAVCAGKEPLCDLPSFPICQEMCATPAPIDKPSSMLPLLPFFCKHVCVLLSPLPAFTSGPPFFPSVQLQIFHPTPCCKPLFLLPPSSLVLPSITIPLLVFPGERLLELSTKGEEQGLKRPMGSRTWSSRAALAPSSDGEGCQRYCCVGMAKVGGRRQRMGWWGGRDLKFQLPLCVFTSSSLSGALWNL